TRTSTSSAPSRRRSTSATPPITASCSRSASVSDSPGHSLVEFTVGGFNSRWGLRRFGAAANTPFDVAAVLDPIDADVLVLPETWVPHGDDGVVEALQARGYQVELARWVTLSLAGPRPRRVAPGEGWWCLAVASRLPVLDRHDLPLPNTIADPAQPRVAIDLTVDVGGTDVEVVGVHTSSRLWWGAP